MQLQLVHQLLSEKASWPACTLARRLAAVQPLQQKAAAMQLLHLVQLQLQHLVQHLQLAAAMQLQLAMLLQLVHQLPSEKAFWPVCMHARSPAAVPLLQQLAAAMQLLLQPQPQLAAATNFSFMALCH